MYLCTHYFNNQGGFQYSQPPFLTIYQIAIWGELFWKLSLEDSLYRGWLFKYHKLRVKLRKFVSKNAKYLFSMKCDLKGRVPFLCRMERYFPLRRTDLVPFLLEHILDKMLKDHGKVALLSAVSCFIEINFTHTGIQNSSLIFTWPTQTPSSRDESNLRSVLVGKSAREVCKQSELN